MLLGMWTTAATFYGLVWVDFPSLEQLGLLIGHSMVLCGVFTLVFVAAFPPRQRPARAVRPLRMARLADGIARRSTLILWSALMLTVMLGTAAARLRLNPTLDRLRSVTPGAVTLQQLHKTFGLPGEAHVILARGPELEPLLEADERMAADIQSKGPGLRIQAASALLPSGRTQAERASRIKAAGLSPATVRAALEEAAHAEGFREETFEPFVRRLPAILDASKRLTYDGYVQNGFSDLIITSRLEKIASGTVIEAAKTVKQTARYDGKRYTIQN